MRHFLLADDHSIVRSGIKTLLQENYPGSAIDEAEDGPEIAEFIKKTSYDLLIMDINMPNADFFSIIRWINTIQPGVRILIFTMHSERVYGMRSIQSGAHGFLNKTASNKEIIIAINKVLDQKRYMSAELAELLLESVRENRSPNPFNNLSTREMEISMLMLKGQSLPDISRQLNIGYSTTNTYKRRIFEKLNVHNIVSLTRLMRSYGFEQQ